MKLNPFDEAIADFLGLRDPFEDSLSRSVIDLPAQRVAGWRMVIAEVAHRMGVPDALAIYLLERAETYPESALNDTAEWREYLVESTCQPLEYLANGAGLQ